MEEGSPLTDIKADGHPAYYDADPELVAAVNASLILGKPLLLTGAPGTGKSELAERIAWEFELGPVLRFEAQSLSESGDIFYRHDLVGRMAESRLPTDARVTVQSIVQQNREALPDLSRTHPARFIEFGALGKAILRANPLLKIDEVMDKTEADRAQVFNYLHQTACKHDGQWTPRRSVVLIDEIDKASRDFPNDLLNGIDRLEFRIRELDNLKFGLPQSDVPQRTAPNRPIVIITSNQERDLPAPFMRRCAFHRIADPDKSRLAKIVRLRVFQDRTELDDDQLPPFYRDLVECFFAYQDQNKTSQGYVVGSTELRDVALALRQMGVTDTAEFGEQRPRIRTALALLAKHRNDIERWSNHINSWQPARG